MTLIDGTKSFANVNPNGASITMSHNHDAGADGLLLAVITMASTTDFSSASYGGAPMTLIRNTNYGGLSQRQAAYVLTNPSDGANTFQTLFSGNQWNPLSISLISFTGASGIGAEESSGGLITPNSQSLTILENSMIYATGISVNAQAFGYDIAGSTRTNLFAHNSIKQVEAALSAQALNAGVQNVTTKADFSTATNYRIEIQEAGGTPPATARRIFVM